jgi:CheY-like chemotaxis protein
MARIACFSDSTALVRAARLGLSGREHAIYPLPCSRLTDDLRQTVRQFAPDVALFELNHALDNPHLFIFLRADAATRDVPVIVVSEDEQLELYAIALGADGFLHSPFAQLQLEQALEPFIGPRRAPAPEMVRLPALPAIQAPAATITIPSRSAALPRTAIPSLVPALALA